MSWHEYTVVGHSRSKIGMYISFMAGAIAGGITTLAGLTVSFFQQLGWLQLPQLVVWPVTGGLVFSILFICFDKSVWRWIRLRSILGVPNMSGSWVVKGKSYNLDGSEKQDWSGQIEITQSYEKIYVWLKTKASESKSISAAIINEGRAGYRLIYSYRNQPGPGEPELGAHMGHCEILFDTNISSAEGSYFNGAGRVTHGKISLTRG